MTTSRSLAGSWRHVLLFVLSCLYCAGGTEEDFRQFQLQHDGLLRFSKSSASLRGIGNAVLRLDDFELSVDGQIQMIGSSRLVRASGKERRGHFQAEPVCVSIVAMGKVDLRFPETGETFSGKIAVYRMSERTWTLDGLPLKRVDEQSR